MYYMLTSTDQDIKHHGILGQKWGKRNGPPYPLDGSDHSASEKKAGWRQSLNSAGNAAAGAGRAAVNAGKEAAPYAKAAAAKGVKMGKEAAPKVKSAAKKAAKIADNIKTAAVTAALVPTGAAPAYLASKYIRKQAKAQKSMSTLQERQSMSDAELTARYNRVLKENNLRELELKNRDAGTVFVGNVSNQVASRVITTAATGGLLYLGAKILGGKDSLGPGENLGKAIFYGGARKK